MKGLRFLIADSMKKLGNLAQFSILELECMLVHIMRLGLKGSNFQGCPISLLISSIA